MIKLVKSADAGKAKIVGVADRWATWIVVTALTAAALAWIFTEEMIRAVTILVVFCPCSLVLATPTAIMAAIGNATKHGFLVRQGDALERLAETKVVTFDKTGTLTYGKPEVVAVEPCMKGLPHLIRLSKRMMKTIAFNMTFSMTLNVIAIVLAIIGTLNPVVGALVHNAGSVFVITNSAFLLNWRKREGK